MSDTASFFANKKKKKKAFTFNANLVDASSVTTTLPPQVDAVGTTVISSWDNRVPLNENNTSSSLLESTGSVSGVEGVATTTADGTATTNTHLSTVRDSAAAVMPDEEQWDDVALAASISRKVAIGTSHHSNNYNTSSINNNTSEGGGGVEGTTGGGGSGGQQLLLDMKSLDSKTKNQGNIAEKLRVDETKAQLAAAREGMERKGAKLQEERAQQQQQQQEKTAKAKSNSTSRFGGIGFGGGGLSMQSGGSSTTAGSGRWVPVHMRSGATGATTGTATTGSTTRRMGGGGGGIGVINNSRQKFDVQDEELFPDLSTADKILIEQKEKDQQSAYRLTPKKTPVGGGATWASKRPATGVAVDVKSSATPAPSSAAAEILASDDVSATASVADSTPSPQVSGSDKEEIKPDDNISACTSTMETAMPVSAAAITAGAATTTTAAKAVKKLLRKPKKDLSAFKPTGGGGAGAGAGGASS